MTFKYYNTTGEAIRIFITELLEPLLYHPIIMFFSLKGYVSFITARELAWGTMTRKGFDDNEDKDKDNKPKDDSNKEKKFNIFEKLKNKKKTGELDPVKT